MPVTSSFSDSSCHAFFHFGVTIRDDYDKNFNQIYALDFYKIKVVCNDHSVGFEREAKA